MEQKKILWIITASGIFLTVVFLFALIVVRTKTSNVPSRAQMPAIEKPMATPVPQKTDDSLTADSVAISKEDIENLSEASESEDTLADAGESVNPIIKNDDGTVTIDLNQARAKAEKERSVKLSGNLCIGIRAMYSTEATMAGAIMVENDKNMYEGIQVVILPESEFKLPIDVPEDVNSVTAHLKLAS